MYDLVIVGAGPAGAAAALAARAARPDRSVLLIDRSDFPRDKACGDAISPHAVRVLRSLGAAHALAGYVPVATFEVTDGASAVRGPLPGDTFTVPRAVFDDRLRAVALAAGARAVRHRVRRLDHAGDHVRLDGEIRGRVLIAADGANSPIRRLLGLDRNPPDALAVAMRGYTRATHGPLQRIMLDGARWPAYGWSFAIGDGTANVGWGTTVARLRALHTAGSAGDLLREGSIAMADGEVTALRAHHLPLSTRRPPPWRERVLLAGDAASLVNPLSGEGIFYALLSGALAGGAAMRSAAPGPAYAAALRRRLRRHMRHTRVAARLLEHAVVRRAGVRAAADPTVFADLTDLALGDGLLTSRMLAAVLRNLRRPAG